MYFINREKYIGLGEPVHKNVAHHIGWVIWPSMGDFIKTVISNDLEKTVDYLTFTIIMDEIRATVNINVVDEISFESGNIWN